MLHDASRRASVEQSTAVEALPLVYARYVLEEIVPWLPSAVRISASMTRSEFSARQPGSPMWSTGVELECAEDRGELACVGKVE
jgi:hypothetical protein